MIKKLSAPFSGFLGRVARSSNSLLYIVLAIVVVLGPIFFVPVYGFSVLTAKGFFMFLLFVIALLVAGIRILKKGGLSLPRHPIFWIMGGLVLSTLIGAVLSPSFGTSFLGYGFETTTWLFVAIFSLAIFFAYKTVSSYQRIGILYSGMLISFLLLVLLQGLRFAFGPAFLSLGVLNSSTSALIGSWSDLGIFFGVILLFSAITLELAGLRRLPKWIVMGIGALSAVALAFMNLSVVWMVIGLVGLLFVLYLFAFAYWDTGAKTYKKENRVPWYVLSLVVLSIVGIFFGASLNALAGHHQTLAWNDLRPSFGTSMHVAEKSLEHNFVTGYGPNSFAMGWSLVKPVSVSGSSVSGANFDLGFSYFVTELASNGILGAILWVVFFVMLAYVLLRRMGRGFESSLERYVVVSLGMLVAYLGIIAWVYVPGSYILVLMAILIGAFLNLSLPGNDRSFSFVKDPRASFFGILGVTVLIVGTLFAGYLGIRKLISFIDDTRGVVFMGKGDDSVAVAEITRAANLASHDIYHAQLAQLALKEVGTIVSGTTAANKSDISRQAEQVLGVALGHAKAATELNPEDYQNWILLGNVYQSAVSLGVTEAYPLAQAAYQEAQKRDPNDATVTLSFANLALANQDTPTALVFIQDSLNQYPTESAYLLRLQLQIQSQDWADAVVTLKQAIILDSSHDPILYIYLGVAYEKSGDVADANQIYALIRSRFKDGDQAVTQIRSNLSGGNAPDLTTASSVSSSGTVAPAPSTTKAIAPKAKK